MKIWLKENWFKILMIITITAAFYWFAFRPSQIRRECSWLSKHSDAVPARPASQNWPTCSSGSALDDLISNTINGDTCHGLELAIPAKDWYERASNSEYQFCLHNRGL